MSAFAAQYPGRCAAGDVIEPGDQVVFVNDELVHVECEGEGLRRAAKPAEVCGECFMERPCPCDDGQGPTR